MLELKNIHWIIPSGEEIIKGINLHISSGKLTVVTGPNGGGKTSIAKLIAGLISPTEGDIILNGINITKLDITERANIGISYAFQQPVHFKGLTVKNILNIAAGESLNEEKLCSLLSKVGLCAKEYINRPIDHSLSGGEIKRIEIATILARKKAKILIFDEPEAGIDLWSFSNLIEVFKNLKSEKDCTLLVISHQERILEIADDIIVIANGRVRIAGGKEIILPRLLYDEKQTICPIDK